MKNFTNIIGIIAIASWFYFYYMLFTVYSDNLIVLSFLCLFITGVYVVLLKQIK